MIKPAPTYFEKLVTVLIWSVSLLIVATMVFVIFQMIGPGLHSIHWNYLFLEPENSGRAGGISSILLSTLLILGVCLLFAVPIGVGTAIWLSEFSDPTQFVGKNIRRSLDVLSGIPSIVFGLFGNALFCRYLGFSILSGGLTLACMVLPILIRSTEIGLSSVPADYRISGAALGISKFSLLCNIILPVAMPGIVVGLVLGIGRAIAESAALTFTSGYVDRFPSSIMDSGRSLSIHIYDLTMNVPGGEPNAYKSIVVILVLLFILNTLTMFLADRLVGRRVTAP